MARPISEAGAVMVTTVHLAIFGFGAFTNEIKTQQHATAKPRSAQKLILFAMTFRPLTQFTPAALTR